MTACKPSSSDTETISLDDVVEGSTENYSIDTTSVEIEKIEFDPTFQKIAEKLELSIVDFIAVDSLLFVDRFENISAYKYQLTNAISSTFFAEWTFANAAAAKNAFINWTQCYGARCNSLVLNDSTSISSEHMAMLLVGKELYYMNTIDEKRFHSFVTELIAEKRLKKIDYAFYQNGRKSVKWFQIEDFEE